MSANRTVTCLRSASMQPSGWLQGLRIADLSGRQRLPLDPVAAAKLEPSQARRCLSLALNVIHAAAESVVAIGSTADKLRRRASLTPQRLTQRGSGAALFSCAAHTIRRVLLAA